MGHLLNLSQSLFYWITYSYIKFSEISNKIRYKCLNPYFIGLPILIISVFIFVRQVITGSQSLFYWITYSYKWFDHCINELDWGLNPYFIGLPILIKYKLNSRGKVAVSQSLFYWITYSYYPF